MTIVELRRAARKPWRPLHKFYIKTSPPSLALPPPSSAAQTPALPGMMQHQPQLPSLQQQLQLLPTPMLQSLPASIAAVSTSALLPLPPAPLPMSATAAATGVSAQAPTVPLLPTTSSDLQVVILD